MRNVVYMLAFSLSIWGLTGCSICCTPYLHDYATYGTKHPRADMVNGRVGSVFSDPNYGGAAYTEGTHVIGIDGDATLDGRNHAADTFGADGESSSMISEPVPMEFAPISDSLAH